jgi:hypothetical protein
MYAIIKDYGDGKFSCENRFVEQQYEETDLATLLSKEPKTGNELKEEGKEGSAEGKTRKRGTPSVGASTAVLNNRRKKELREDVTLEI